MSRIWKWGLAVTDRQTIRMPLGARILAVQVQHTALQLWAMCNTGEELADRHIAIYGTGHPLPTDPGEYIGTAQTSGGTLTWHVFERPTGGE